MKILTVLRSGGDFTLDHAERIRAQCAEFAPGVPFHCLSDVPEAPGLIPLNHDWPGWWAKMEMFRIPGPCLYMDLDTTLRANLGPMLEAAQTHDLIAIRDFNWPRREVQSSIMAWSGDQTALYAAFKADPTRHMAENNTPRWWGDQGFIERNADPAFWQDVTPGAVVSWKRHCAGRETPPEARAIVFHGKPRPWEVGQ